MFGGSWWVDFRGIASDVTRRHSLRMRITLMSPRTQKLKDEKEFKENARKKLSKVNEKDFQGNNFIKNYI